MKSERKNTIESTVGIIVHVVAWFYIFASPFFFSRRGENFNWNHYWHGLVFPLATCLIFYANYFWLVPRYVLQHKYRLYVLGNLLLVLVVTCCVECYLLLSMPVAPYARPRGLHPPRFPKAVLVVRGMFTYVFSIVMAAAVRLSVQWRKAENARKEAELGRTEAELQNLKNQISPHFLLNTLNNIYALTAIDSEKAQQAVLELSRMLRFLLYENQASAISLQKEADFLNTYIALMRLRVAKDVDVRFDVCIPSDGHTPEVAPLIFISLVENAFKHGISPVKPSFIHISLTADAAERTIRFTVRNSNYPKNRQDKSGSGIGLQQVSRRLQLSYPQQHTWYHGPSPDGKTYLSSILIGGMGAVPETGEEAGNLTASNK